MYKFKVTIFIALFFVLNNNKLESLPKCMFVGNYGAKKIIGVGDIHGSQVPGILLYEPEYTPTILKTILSASNLNERINIWIEGATLEKYQFMLKENPSVKDSLQTLWTIAFEQNFHLKSIRFFPIDITESGNAIDSVAGLSKSLIVGLDNFPGFVLNNKVLAHIKKSMGIKSKFTLNEFLKETRELIEKYDKIIPEATISEATKTDFYSTLERAKSMLKNITDKFNLHQEKISGLLDLTACDSFYHIWQLSSKEGKDPRKIMSDLCGDGGVDQIIGILGDIKLIFETIDLIKNDSSDKQLFYLGADHIIALRKALLTDPNYTEIIAEGDFNYEALAFEPVTPEKYIELCEQYISKENIVTSITKNEEKKDESKSAETSSSSSSTSSTTLAISSSSSSSTLKTISQSSSTSSSSSSTSSSSSSSSSSNICICGKIGSKKCGVCKKHYCSRECQVADWPKHKLICK